MEQWQTAAARVGHLPTSQKRGRPRECLPLWYASLSGKVQLAEESIAFLRMTMEAAAAAAAAAEAAAAVTQRRAINFSGTLMMKS
jgi:hypothetical protein